MLDKLTNIRVQSQCKVRGFPAKSCMLQHSFSFAGFHNQSPLRLFITMTRPKHCTVCPKLSQLSDGSIITTVRLHCISNFHQIKATRQNNLLPLFVILKGSKAGCPDFTNWLYNRSILCINNRIT